MADSKSTTIDAIRQFNRYYWGRLSQLESALPGGMLLLTERFVLQEIANRPLATASDIIRELAIDPGYLSRLLKSLEQQRYIARKRSLVDARQYHLKLLPAGAAALAQSDRAERARIARLIHSLPAGQLEQLTQALSTVHRLMDWNKL